MKQVLITVALILLGMITFAETGGFNIPEMPKPMDQMTKEELKDFYAKKRAAIQALTPEQKQAYISQRKAQRFASAGGLITKSEGHGRVVYANLQKAVSSSDIAQTMNVLAKHLHIQIDTLDAKKEEVADIENYLLAHKAQAVVIVDDNPVDSAILVAPEDKWAKVNIARFKDANIGRRTQMELLRAFCFLCGGIGSEYPNPLTGFVSNAAQLDSSPIVELPVDVINRFTPYLKQLGVIPSVQSTYRQACKEGWAPPPTNDVQKAIWEKVKNGGARK